MADGLIQHETNGVSTVGGRRRPAKNREYVSRGWLVANFWQERQDSNPRPLVLETSALARLSYAPAWYPWRDSNPRRAT